MSRIIPEQKIEQLRFGQLLINALVWGGYLKPVVTADSYSYAVSKLDPFYIENDDLEIIVQNFLAEHASR